ncbi:hypothetical protein [Kitasatospora sp. NPDC088351]|uniref:alpha/beta fold hydrolase n=1 Tax=unclassified Kitasatospora TaxID=2633591 RepID=UPI0034274F53
MYALGHAGFPASRVVTGPRPTADRLRRLTAPVLVLPAEHRRAHDALRVADRARGALPEAAVTVLPGVSHHTLPMARPAELNLRLTDFLAARP